MAAGSAAHAGTRSSQTKGAAIWSSRRKRPERCRRPTTYRAMVSARPAAVAPTTWPSGAPPAGADVTPTSMPDADVTSFAVTVYAATIRSAVADEELLTIEQLATATGMSVR